MNTDWLDELFFKLAHLFPDGSFFNISANIKGTLAVILVSLVCGAVGSLVVGNRMAFFSDALSHCALAGVGLGFILGLLGGVFEQSKEAQEQFIDWIVPVMTVAFGVAVGVGIAFVREKTALASDTVIGVFFAGALGLAAILLKYLALNPAAGQVLQLENLVFGEILTVRSSNLLMLLGLLALTALMLVPMYNSLVFNSFNPSLARSRRLPVRLCDYLFIVLLAVLVNVCLRIVGALLINALLVVPAAAAGNVSRNMRQLFWVTVGLCLASGLVGMWLSWDLRLAGSGGSIVVVSVVLFFASMLFLLRPVRALWPRLANFRTSGENK